LRVFQNRVLRRIFGPAREENVVVGWRELHNKELLFLYTSPYIIMFIKRKRMRLSEQVARIGDMRRRKEVNWNIKT